MIQLHNTSNWQLDDNGITIVNVSGRQVIDLRNECEIRDVIFQDDTLRIRFEKQTDEIKPPVIPAGALVTLMLCNLEKVETIPKGNTFEGIYDFDSQSLNLCVDDGCSLLKGHNITLKLVLNT